MEEPLPPITSRLGDTDPTQDTLSPFIYMPFLIATIASACFVAFRRIQAAEFYDKWKLKLVSLSSVVLACLLPSLRSAIQIRSAQTGICGLTKKRGMTLKLIAILL